MITEAVAATRWYWPDVPPQGMVTFIDPAKVRHKRDYGRCYLRAGFTRCGTTKAGLLAFQILPPDMPEPAMPLVGSLGLQFLDEIAPLNP